MKLTKLKKLKIWQKFNKEMEPNTTIYVLELITVIIGCLAKDLNLKTTYALCDIIVSITLGYMLAWATSTLIVNTIYKKELKKNQKETNQ